MTMQLLLGNELGLVYVPELDRGFASETIQSQEGEKASGNGRQRTGRGPFRDVGRKDPTPLSQGPL